MRIVTGGSDGGLVSVVRCYGSTISIIRSVYVVSVITTTTLHFNSESTYIEETTPHENAPSDQDVIVTYIATHEKIPIIPF